MLKFLHYFHPLNKHLRKIHSYHASEKLSDSLLEILHTPGICLDMLVDQSRVLAIDFETTGLDAQVDQILSIGFVELHQGKIKLNSAEQMFIKAHDSVKPETAVINHIVPEMLDNGLPLDEAMDRLFDAMKGKLLLAHGSQIEQAFIERYIHQRYTHENFPLLWLDTLKLEKTFFGQQEQTSQQEYRLAMVRQSYGLPDYPGHGALVDAVATAELFTVMQKRIVKSRSATLGELYRQ